jgi:PKD domain
MRQLLTAGLLAATLLLLIPVAALAAPQWLGAEPLDPGFSGSGQGADVATDADGNSAAVWIGSGGEVNAAVRPRGGPWGAPQNLEPGGQVQIEDQPRVIAEPDGEFVAVWVGDLGGTSGNYIRWAHKPPGEDWSAPDFIVQASSGSATLLALEVGGSGDVTVLWTTGTDPVTPNTNTKPAGRDTWEAADPVPNTPASHLALAVAPDGSSVVAYPDPCGQFFDSCVRAEFRPKGGDWGAEPELAGSAAGEVTGVAAAARPDSSYAVVWGEGVAPAGRGGRSQNPPGAVSSADRAAGGTSWSQQTVTDLPADAAGCPSATSGCIDLASRGDTLAAVWQQGGAEAGEIEASLRTGDGAWGARERVGDVGNGDASPQAALTADGTAVAAWGDGPSGSAVARASHRATDGTWTQKEIGSPAEGAAVVPDVVADGLGDAVTAWRDPNGVQAAGFDGSGPRFDTFSAPATGTVGATLPFAATADDNWSGLSSITWGFGDGGTATGGEVNHAYNAVGGFTATATARDGIGNLSQASGPVSVIAVPTPTPTPNPCGTADRDKDGINDGCDTSDGAKPPVAFKTVNATVVSGDVFVKLPSGGHASAAAAKPPKGFVRLQGAQTIPVGSTLDTAKGRVRLRSAADTRHHVQSGQFFRGRFLIRQVRKPRGKAKHKSTKLITELRLTGSSFSKTCKTKTTASAAAKRRSKKRVRRLFGDGKGSFRTRGRNAAATVRGTRWSVQDRCDGTLVTVQRGTVSVRDLVRHKTVTVKTGHTYLARRR